LSFEDSGSKNTFSHLDNISQLRNEELRAGCSSANPDNTQEDDSSTKAHGNVEVDDLPDIDDNAQMGCIADQGEDNLSSKKRDKECLDKNNRNKLEKDKE